MLVPDEPTSAEEGSGRVLHRRAIVLLALLVFNGCSSGAPASPAVSPPATATSSALAATPSATLQIGWQVVADAPAFEGGTVYDVIAAGPGFVAVGSVSVPDHNVAAAWTSPDGITWTRAADTAAYTNHLLFRATLYNNTILGAAYNCAGTTECGDGAIWTSTDGSVWQPGDAMQLGYRIEDLNSSPTALVAVADSEDTLFGAAFSSSDGKTWKPSASNTSTLANSNIGAVGFGPTSAALVGSQSGNPLAWWSTDGVTWSAGTGSFGSGEMRGVAGSAAAMIAVGRGGGGAGVWSSADGKSWQQEPTSAALTGGVMDAVAVAGSEFVAVGKNSNSGTIWTSTDGSSWNLESLPTSLSGAEMTSVTANATTIVAIGALENGRVAVAVKPI